MHIPFLSLQRKTKIMYKNQILTLEDTMKFGKHCGETISQIVDENPSYIRWIIENVDNIAFDMDVLAELNLSESILALNDNKISDFEDDSSDYDYDEDEYNGYHDDSDWMEDTWDAMTDGAYGDMPDGFDGDFSFMGY